MAAQVLPEWHSNATGTDALVHDKITSDIQAQGYSINFNALSPGLMDTLWRHVQQMDPDSFELAGTGREHTHRLNHFVRKDQVCWINGESEAGKVWLNWAEELRISLNRSLMLGLFSFESHFALYEPGAFYRRHLDAFKGEANRVLSLVLYLNPGWQPEDEGELVLYTGASRGNPIEGERSEEGHPGGQIKVAPGFATLVTFLSEDFPHEVLPANRHRYSIAGWFRVNGSSCRRVDPPR